MSTQQVAVVTGGTGSLGSAICGALAEAGYRVLAADVTDEPRTPLPDTVEYVRLDVASVESVRHLVAEVLSRGTPHVLVNAHGVLHETTIETMLGEELEETLVINVAGVARVSAALAPHLAAGSSITTLSSIAARIGRLPGSAAYAASKAGVEGLTRSLACSLAPRVRVNAIGVGFVETPMRGDGELMRSRATDTGATLREVPMGRLARVGDIAGVVRFLASDAASYITGTTIMVGGGVTAR